MQLRRLTGLERKQIEDELAELMKLIAKLEKILGSERSEERRVGKECRSLCDWSSDVCSSDLHAAAPPHRPGAQADRGRVGRANEADRQAREDPRLREIGRASCRERV